MSSHLSALPAPARRGLNAKQAETVERLLVAGLEELRTAGADALTVRSVAQRAGVSPATAYTYLASKNHLVAELFRRHLHELDLPGAAVGDGHRARLLAVVTRLSEGLVAEPQLTAAVTPALLGTDPDVARLRLRIGAQLVAGFEAALAHPVTGEVDRRLVDVLVLSLSGALLQAGMGVVGYEDVADRLADVVGLVDLALAGGR